MFYLFSCNKYSLSKNVTHLNFPNVTFNMMEMLHGKKYADELEFLPLLNNTVSRRMREGLAISQAVSRRLLTAAALV
jgi:hypothetical protein